MSRVHNQELEVGAWERNAMPLRCASFCVWRGIAAAAGGEGIKQGKTPEQVEQGYIDAPTSPNASWAWSEIP